MLLESNFSLQPYNTFGIDVSAAQLLRVDSYKTIAEALQSPQVLTKPLMVLGGGSNILFTSDYPGTILKNEIMGRELLREDSEYVWVQLGAGEDWHQVVLWAIEQGWGGIENLSLIPGTVGAAPMQNIGAYGVELSEVFESLQAVHLQSGELSEFNAEQCQFGYRYSIFKGAMKGQYMILSVTLRLTKHPKFNTSYGAVEQTLNDMGVAQLTLKDVSNAVIHIRESKLPDPQEIGNAGSFFKNPVIAEAQYQRLKQKFPDIPGYPNPPQGIKVPAGWLIEQCQWKGQRRGAVGVHQKQALVLVNHGGAKGEDIKQLAMDIKASVQREFEIELNPEVNII